jgi:hypothetical protein
VIPDVRSDSGFGRAGAHDEGSSVHIRGEKAWGMLGAGQCITRSGAAWRDRWNHKDVFNSRSSYLQLQSFPKTRSKASSL